MESPVNLKDRCDFTDSGNCSQNLDSLLALQNQIRENDYEGIFVVHSAFTSLIGLRCLEDEKTERGQKYYSIYDEVWPGEFIYNDIAEALRKLKELKYARMKSFPLLEEAVDFATSGGRSASFNFPLPSNFKFPLADQTFWKAPRCRDLVRFRRALQSGDLALVKEMVSSNPRYLIGNGDTPTILQVGCRYNALHVAALASSSVACSYVLSVISDIDFAERLYGENQSNQLRIDVLLDLYLNMPDKGCHETPLHFASKLGALDVIKVLISYRQCDKTVKNKYGLTPMDVACTRFPDHLKVKNEISVALGRPFFVPLLRSKDNVLQPMVGEPCTAENSPVCFSDRLSPPLEVKAVAGPMSEELAFRFRKKWKTPPRDLNCIRDCKPHLSDPEKGFEKLGRKLAGEYNVGWKEYWSFLDKFVDLTSREGLSILDSYLKNKYQALEEINPYHQVLPLYFRSKSQLYSLSTEEKSFDPYDSPPFDQGHCTGTPKLDDSRFWSDNTEHMGFNFSPIDTDKYFEVFARRITNSLSISSQTWSEISYFQKFLAACSGDERFRHVDLTNSHLRLSVSIAKTVSEEPELLPVRRQSLNQILNLNGIESFDDPGIIDFEDLLRATTCILQNVNKILSIQKGDTEENICSTKPCDCKLPIVRITSAFSLTALSRRLSLSDGEDSSGSDDTFYTVLSDAEVEYDDHSPVSEIFLTGNSPTKVDQAVLEAIGTVSWSPSDYPYLSKWKMSCERIRVRNNGHYCTYR